MGKLFLFSIFRQKKIAQDAKGLRLSVRSSNLDGLMLYFHYELVVTKQILSSLNILFKFVKPLGHMQTIDRERDSNARVQGTWALPAERRSRK